MRFGSVCSGVEAASLAWQPLGWQPSFYSEIEDFPREVLKFHHPEISLHGDFTTIGAEQYDPIDLLVGGTPCQSFSIAGLRKGMADDRGNLALEFLKLAKRTRPHWVVWENVPGVLSSHGGRDFGALLGGLGEIGYGFAYRVFNAQYFGVPQRRRRVFLVGYLGDWRPPASVLFERESLRGDPVPSREKGEGLAGTTRDSSEGRGVKTFRMKGFGDYVDDDRASTVKERDYKDSTDLVVYCADTSPTVTSSGPPFSRTGNSRVEADAMVVMNDNRVRRLTPVEVERLQGFPDNYTKIAYRGKPADQCPDAPRYSAMGNSMAVPVMNWIGKRIDEVDKRMGVQ